MCPNGDEANEDERDHPDAHQSRRKIDREVHRVVRRLVISVLRLALTNMRASRISQEVFSFEGGFFSSQSASLAACLARTFA